MEKAVDSASSKPQIVIGISDYHDKDHPANADQRAYLESILKRHDVANIKLIVEDLSSVNNNGRGVCCSYIISARGGLLGKLADTARGYSLDVDNIEYRFCRVAGVGPLINKEYERPYDSASTAAIPMDALCKEVLDELKHIADYNDGIRINAEYKRIIDEVTKAFYSLKLDQVKGMSIADYCARFNKDTYKKSLERLCVFDSSLIDAKIIHSIVSSDKPIIIVAGGGSHIDNVNTFLASIRGYKKTVMPPVTEHKYQSVNSSLGTGNKKRFFGRPLAINLTAIEQFLHQ